MKEPLTITVEVPQTKGHALRLMATIINLCYDDEFAQTSYDDVSWVFHCLSKKYPVHVETQKAME